MRDSARCSVSACCSPCGAVAGCDSRSRPHPPRPGLRASPASDRDLVVEVAVSGRQQVTRPLWPGARASALTTARGRVRCLRSRPSGSSRISRSLPTEHGPLPIPSARQGRFPRRSGDPDPLQAASDTAGPRRRHDRSSMPKESPSVLASAIVRAGPSTCHLCREAIAPSTPGRLIASGAERSRPRQRTRRLVWPQTSCAARGRSRIAPVPSRRRSRCRVRRALRAQSRPRRSDPEKRSYLIVLPHAGHAEGSGHDPV